MTTLGRNILYHEDRHPFQQNLQVSGFENIEEQNSYQQEMKRYNSSSHVKGKISLETDEIHQKNEKTLKKLRKIKQLRKQRQQLKYSLQILKTSVNMALQQKNDQIQKLTRLNSFNDEQKLQYYESQVNNSRKHENELKQKQQQLQDQLYQQRSRYIDQLQERQNLIENLQDQILEIQQEIQIFHKKDEVKEQTIKFLQEHNSKLFVQLQFSTLSMSLKEHKENNDIGFKLNSEESVASSIHHKSTVSLHQEDHLFQNQNDKTYLSSKLEEVSKENMAEIQQLKNFYEKRIVDLKNIYEKELSQPIEHAHHLAEEYYHKKHNEHQSHSDRMQPSNRSKSNKLSSGLCLNLNNIYSIQENAEDMLQTSRDRMNSLKFQIKNQNNYNQNLVQIKQTNLYTNQDTESQFTTKYFQNPFRFMKKHKSVETISVQNQQQKTLLKHYKEQTDTMKNQVKQQKEMSIWNKSCIFGVGLLSGIAVTALVTYLVRKI